MNFLRMTHKPAVGLGGTQTGTGFAPQSNPGYGGGYHPNGAATAGEGGDGGEMSGVNMQTLGRSNQAAQYNSPQMGPAMFGMNDNRGLAGSEKNATNTLNNYAQNMSFADTPTDSGNRAGQFQGPNAYQAYKASAPPNPMAARNPNDPRNAVLAAYPGQ